MRFLSLFSGIEAASVAWKPLGWECVGVAEIDPFPCAVLKHHYPDVPNLGSVTDITDEQIAALGPIDLVVGGSPCQDLSVAGKRAGLAGERSGLFHEQLRIFHAARHLCGARYLLWENVPGAFSSNRGRDFAVVVGAMAGCRVPVPSDGWGTEGVVLGEHGLVEWVVLDAQWFGVAQRRRRVFALLDVGDWSGRPPILLEPDSMRGDSAPSREAGKVAPCIPSRRTGGGGLGTDFDCDGGLIHAPEGSSQDYETTTMVVAGCIKGAAIGRQPNNGPQFGDAITDGSCYTLTTNEVHAVAHTLRGEGFDASEDGTGRGTPPVPVACDVAETLTVGESQTWGRPGGGGLGTDFDCDGGVIAMAHGQGGAEIGYDRGPTLTCNHEAPIVAHTLRGEGFDASEDGTGRGTPIVPVVAPCLTLRGREGGGTAELGDEVQNCLRASGGGGDKPHVLAAMTVRRLTVKECSRLQGFPDDYLLQVPWRGKTPPADGPMYKALGNSFAVPVVRWIGSQIERASAWRA